MRYLRLIQNYYGNRCAKRSGVPLMNHILEGMEILSAMGADEATKNAFCIHPLLQNDVDLIDFQDTLFDSEVAILAMEYRSVANSYLPKNCSNSDDNIKISVLPRVNLMLIADKIQNKKDFELYNKGKIPNSDTLDLYFNNWFKALHISDRFYTDTLERMK